MTRQVCTLAVLVLIAAANGLAQPGPFDGKNFSGRIGWSCDGNHNDEDDWAASPVALAIFAEAGLKDKVVHFDYNSILNQNDPEWAKIHEASVLGAVEQYGYDASLFHDCQKKVEAAIDSITRAVNASSTSDPFYLVIAGPMEVAFRAFEKSDRSRREFVYVISHSRWNDGFATDYTYNYNKRNIIPTGVNWVQIRDQNEFLSNSPYGRPAKDAEWEPFQWMRDSGDEKVRFLWERLRVSTRADCSDAGMAYFLVSGDEASEIGKVRRLLDDNVVPKPLDPRPYVRIEAENFVHLEQFELDYKNDRKVSHRINVQRTGAGKGRIRTPLKQPYTAASGRYDVGVRYFDGAVGQSRLTFSINGAQRGDPWLAVDDDDTWKLHTISDVVIAAGDEIMVELERDGLEAGKLDYVELNYKGR